MHTQEGKNQVQEELLNYNHLIQMKDSRGKLRAELARTGHRSQYALAELGLAFAHNY